MIEAEVHQSLRAFLRSHPRPYWPHHLTMARLVARALRLGRSALIQTGVPSLNTQGSYRLSYLMSVLLWPEPVVLVATEAVQQRLLMVEIPQLQQWIGSEKPIQIGDRWPYDHFQGLLLISPSAWLGERLASNQSIPGGITTIIDGADDLETWACDQLTAKISPADWHQLMQLYPDQADRIRDLWVKLTRAIFQHPPNPYQCCLLDGAEIDYVKLLAQVFPPTPQIWPPAWQYFWQRFQTNSQLLWAEIYRQQGFFSLFCGAVEVASALAPIWYKQPIVLIGGMLDLTAAAPIFRQQMGLGDLTAVKFSTDRQHEMIQLYLPDRLPMPNTPQFQSALIREVSSLICVSPPDFGLTVLLISDMPLKYQVGASLAADFGSRVQVEKTCLDDNGVLISGWKFWQEHQAVLPVPRLLIVATLPIPSLENPLVAGRVAYYKQLRQDWFRLYLLPVALNELTRAIAPLREHQGIVAILDNRVNHRSYGHQVLAALSPLARINYLDATLFTHSDHPTG